MQASFERNGQGRTGFRSLRCRVQGGFRIEKQSSPEITRQTVRPSRAHPFCGKYVGDFTHMPAAPPKRFALICLSDPRQQSVMLSTSTKRFATFLTLRLGSRVFERVALLGIGRGHQSARPPRFQAVFVGRTPSVTALALRDVVVAFFPREDFSTTSSSATQLRLFKLCVNRRKTRLVPAHA